MSNALVEGKKTFLLRGYVRINAEHSGVLSPWTSCKTLCTVVNAGSDSKTAWRKGWATDSFREVQSPPAIFHWVYETVFSHVNFLNA